jgi:mRNA interferase HigB
MQKEIKLYCKLDLRHNEFRCAGVYECIGLEGPDYELYKQVFVPKLGIGYSFAVRIIAKRTLRQFWERDRRYVDARRALEDWHAQVGRADWATPADVKALYGDASILKGSRVVFNICGNKYRLIVKINYPCRVVYIRFVGTHAEYDQVDAETV